jgi:molybdate transport system substrate-binding protein
MHRSPVPATALGLALLGIPAGCSESTPVSTLTVFAAASATDVVTELAATFPVARVRTSFGSSSGLARQIADGAPADLFVSASREWMEFLRDAGRLAGEPVVFAHNRLVCVTATGSALAERLPRSAAELSAEIPEGERVAIADEGVPAGEYARQSLAATGDLDGLRPHLVGQDDVRAVLRAVAAGEAAAGFVYSTDARVAHVDVLFALDDGSHDPIEYLAAAVRGSPTPELATVFLEHLAGPPAQEVLKSAGFGVPHR